MQSMKDLEIGDCVLPIKKKDLKLFIGTIILLKSDNFILKSPNVNFSTKL
jgi:hypothetical protein